MKMVGTIANFNSGYLVQSQFLHCENGVGASRSVSPQGLG
jgi:hypothetical protein